MEYRILGQGLICIHWELRFKVCTRIVLTFWLKITKTNFKQTIHYKKSKWANFDFMVILVSTRLMFMWNKKKDP